jgi:hypothetical protein
MNAIHPLYPYNSHPTFSLKAFRPKFCTHFSPPPFVRYVCPLVSIHLINPVLLGEDYSYETLHYAIFWRPCYLLLPSYVQIFCWTPYSQTLWPWKSININPLLPQTKQMVLKQRFVLAGFNFIKYNCNDTPGSKAAEGWSWPLSSVSAKVNHA